MTEKEQELNDKTFRLAHVNSAREFCALLQYIRNADDMAIALDEVENKYQEVLRELTGGTEPDQIVYDMS